MCQSLDATVIHTQEFEVQPQHCDLQNHLNNVVYIQWVQDAAIAAYAAKGYSREMDEQNNIIWFVRRHEVDYLAPAFVGETIRTGSGVRKSGIVSSKVGNRFHILIINLLDRC